MIDEYELEFRRLKFEQVNSEIKGNVQEKSGKLGFRQVNSGIKDQNQKLSDISSKTLKIQKE